MNNVCQHVVDNKEALRAVGLLVVLAWETWLGKTDKVQAGSTLELVYNLLLPQKKPEEKIDNGN